jgi:phage tail-like protein
MTVSSEHRGRRVSMPDVVGLELRDARAVLRNAGIHEFRLHYTETYANEQEIVGQEPRGGLLIERGRDVVLNVCRRSMVQYLPQVYQQSAPDGSFLRGYLYIIQQISDSVAQHIAHAYELFDPRTARQDFLPWVASWLAITLSPDWGELQRRQMLLAATRLFPYRGTAYSIQEFVRIYTGAAVTVEENTWPYQGFRVGVASAVGLDSVILPPMNLAHCFVVRLDRPSSEVSDAEVIKIHQIIQLQKPAHTSYYLAFEDEADGGEMAAFVEIGSWSVGVGGAGGIGVGVGEPAVEAAPEPPSSQRQKASSSRAAKEAPTPQKTTSKKAKVQAKEEPAAEPTPDKADEDSKTTDGAAAGAKKSDARARRAAEAAAAREARKARAADRAVEREQSRTNITAVTDDDLVELDAKSKDAKSKSKDAKSKDAKSKSKDAKPKDAKSKDAKSKDAKSKDAKPKDAKPKDAKPKDAKREDAKPKDAKREARRKRAAEAAAAREARKVRAADRAVERERSRTDIAAITDEDMAALDAKSKSKDTKSKAASDDDAAAKREARRKRTEAAAAAREKRKADAAKRSADRGAKKKGGEKGSGAGSKKDKKK